MSKMANPIANFSEMTISLTVFVALFFVVSFFIKRKSVSKEKRLKKLGNQFSFLAIISFLAVVGAILNAVHNAIRFHLMLSFPLWQVAGLVSEGLPFMQLQVLLTLFFAFAAFVCYLLLADLA